MRHALLVAMLLNLLTNVEPHGTMTKPTPRQPESLYWYQVGCLAGCKCSGGGKETYPTASSLNCNTPVEPKLTDEKFLTWNIKKQSPKQDWNKYMPWKSPGTSIPLDSCGIASGFLPTAKVQFPHQFSDKSIKQGDHGSKLKKGAITYWLPGSTVDVAFSLVVNHGGGYQYRVCPSGQNVDEKCFESNPLKFATTTHTVKIVDDTPFEIAATDVNTGVIPEGSTWRRLPIPACNCDLGSSCSTTSTNNDYKSYADDAAFKTCLTGLQFSAPHLDKVWPGGYGYYMSDVGKTSKAQDNCSNKTKSECDNLKAENCVYNEAKSICYSTKSQKSGSDECGKKKNENDCNTVTGCTWHKEPNKTVCYKPNKRRSLNDGFDEEILHSGRKLASKYNWEIVDKVIAPKELGNYILQWRWDNEQTPQIWTTCADITVTNTIPSVANVVQYNFLFAVFLMMFVVFIL